MIYSKKRGIYNFLFIIFLNIILISCNTSSSQDKSTLYPVKATATKYGQTINMPDLSGLPAFSATFNELENKVIVRNGDNKLTLYPSANSYSTSGSKGSLSYYINAYLNNKSVNKIIYTEIEDDVEVEIIYEVK